MITEEMIKAKVAQFPDFLTETGAKKILEHQEKNKLLYGESIYDKYYEAYEKVVSAKKTGDADKIKEANEELAEVFKHEAPTPTYKGELK